ncbi:signal recognition particle protein [Gemmatimonadota bacterium]
MFDALTSRLTQVFEKMRGRGVLTEENVGEALREVRRALLEADVNVRVARSFIDSVRGRVLGERIIRGVNPGQQMVRAVHAELVEVLGGDESRSDPEFTGRGPQRVLLIGLQGSGKTTLSAKLARRWTGQGKRVALLGLDTRRPAAGEQLHRLAEQAGTSVAVAPHGVDPLSHSVRLAEMLESDGSEVVVIDTAGRQTVDAELMDGLAALHSRLRPSESFLVLDAMTGQDAVRTAEAFSERVACTGAVLTKLDGDTRGGAALSLRSVTGVPIRYGGTGEGLDALEPFHAERMAGRMLGMGDVVSLVEKAAERAGGSDVLADEGRRLAEGAFTLADFREQLSRLRSMGSLEELAGMLPGPLGRALSESGSQPGALVASEAIIDSMTREERLDPAMIDGSRRRRIARGSGRSVQEVNSLLKQYEAMKKMAKALRGKGRGRRGRLPFPGF